MCPCHRRLREQANHQQLQQANHQQVPATHLPASLMNLFITITDCQMDYTPPITLRTASRVIVRLGELRFSSNIVTSKIILQIALYKSQRFLILQNIPQQLLWHCNLTKQVYSLQLTFSY